MFFSGVMYTKNIITAGLATLCLYSVACVSIPARNGLITEPKEAQINLQKRIDEFMKDRSWVNVYMTATDGGDAPLYGGPANKLPKLERMLLSVGVFQITSSNGSLFATVVLSSGYVKAKIEVDYESNGEQLKLPLGGAELSGLADALR